MSSNPLPVGALAHFLSLHFFNICCEYRFGGTNFDGMWGKMLLLIYSKWESREKSTIVRGGMHAESRWSLFCHTLYTETDRGIPDIAAARGQRSDSTPPAPFLLSFIRKLRGKRYGEPDIHRWRRRSTTQTRWWVASASSTQRCLANYAPLTPIDRTWMKCTSFQRLS